MEDKENNKKSSSQSYMKYASLAFQLAGLLIFAVLIGQWLDEKLGNETPYITALLALFFLVAYLIKLYFDLQRP
jgi:uncharacterized membrane protein AbrB (regulator of aidB expression)